MKKKVMNKIRALWKDESAQGATEYILLLAIVVGIAMLFGPRIKDMITSKMQEISGKVAGFGVDP